MAAIDKDPEVFGDSPEELAETIKGLQETDLVVINGDTRTYHVTDVVEQKGDDGDGYDERYVIRLEWRRDDCRLALVLEEGAKTNIEVLGQTITVEPGELSTMTLLQDDELVVRGGDPGIYGLLRVPFERE